MKSSKLIKINCPLCGKDLYSILFPSTLKKGDFDPQIIKEDLKNTLGNYKKHSRIVKCKSCGLVYTNPMENVSKLSEGYEEVVDDEYLQTEKYRKILSLEHLKNIEKFKKKGKILDVGCFAGYFLELAIERGWKAYGIEPSLWANKIAKKRGINIISDSIEKASLKDNCYDAITLWDVIEHLPNPKQVLKKCYASLSNGGIMALGTPNMESLISKILGSNNPYILRMHLVFYSPETLGRMLDEVGFKTVKIYSYGRTFPVSYILDRIRLNNILYKSFQNLINSFPGVSNYPIHLNLRDSFTVIAQK